jgi:hypothetical protein
MLVFAMLGAARSTQAQMEHVLFITNTTFNISPSCNPLFNQCIGGSDPLNAADAQCKQAAEAFDGELSLTREYKALISSSTENANARMPIIGRVVNMAGELLANNQSDLWDGSIATGINYNELNVRLANNSTFWTGSNQFGIVSQNALNWTSTSGGQHANYGRSQIAVSWMNQGTISAGSANRLACLCEARVINPGDFNDDGQIDAADYVVWRKSVGDTVARGASADGDGDGLVTLADFDVWRAKFGTVYSTGNGTGLQSNAVPEPSTYVLALFACACSTRRRLRK